MRAGWWLAVVAAMGLAGVPAAADGPEKRPSKVGCAGFSHPAQVAAVIRAGMACEPAAALYFACQDRWFNNPDLEEVTVNACDNETPPLGDRLAERYEQARERCETRFQAQDGRILGSAVRDCKVRLARDWARRLRRR